MEEKAKILNRILEKLNMTPFDFILRVKEYNDMIGEQNQRIFKFYKKFIQPKCDFPDETDKLILESMKEKNKKELKEKFPDINSVYDDLIKLDIIESNSY
jgi:hypothetical protein